MFREFQKILKYFLKTNQQTDRQTRLGIDASSRSIKIGKELEKIGKELEKIGKELEKIG